MRKRIQLILLLLLLFHGSGDLRAETRPEDCQALDRYVTEAKTNFTGLRGRLIDEYTFEANMFLPDASNCEIKQYLGDEWDASCSFLFISEGERDAGLREIERTIAQCAGYAPENYRMQISNLMVEQIQITQQQGYGNYSHIMAAIMAHEWAHIKQFTVIADPPPGKPMELCADEVAGWYMGVRAAQLWGNVDIKNSIDAFHRIGDFNYNSPQHHGTPEERYNAFGRGLMAAQQNMDFATAFNVARRNAGL